MVKNFNAPRKLKSDSASASKKALPGKTRIRKIEASSGTVVRPGKLSDPIKPRKRPQKRLSDSKRIAEALTREEILLQEIIAAIPDAIVYTDVNRKVVGVNPAFERLFGFDISDIRGKNTSILYESPEEYERQGRIRFNLNAYEAVLPYEVQYRREDRSTFPGETLGTAIKDARRKTVGYIGVIRDITERKQTEELLVKQNFYLEKAQDMGLIGTWEIDLVNDVLTWTDQNYLIFGIPVGTPLNLASFLQCVHPDDQDFVAAKWKAAVAGAPYDIEHRVVCDGRVKWVREKAEMELDANGNAFRAIGIAQDITEKRRLIAELEEHHNHLEELVGERTEQLLEAQQQAEAANMAKSTFLASMSHEIRTPMNAIMGLTHLMQNANPTPMQTDHLAGINNAAEHLLAVINNILDVSKIEAGKFVLEQKDFSLEKVFDSVRSLLEERAQSKALSLEFEIGETPDWLHGDATRLRQCLLNYIGNAVKFTEHGSVTVSVRQLDEDADGVLLRFEVTDTGIGISADKLPGLFQAFEQADISTTRKYGGTGLGLVVTQHLAQLMGGEAGAESEPGKGSTFWFTARFGHGEAIQKSELRVAARHPPLDCSGMRVLLVEDNEINRVVAMALLERIGVYADAAEDGRDAINRVTESAYDLILMDVQMPNADGLEATRLIRCMDGSMPGPGAEVSYRDVPIVAMTASAFEEDRQACLQAGMNDFIAKPFDPGDLHNMVSKWSMNR